MHNVTLTKISTLASLFASLLLFAPGAIAEENLPQGEAVQLVQRDRVLLNLAGAKLALAAAHRMATEMELRVNIAVVDDGGHLLAFARMDGARPASSYTSITKAVSAATQRGATGPLPPGGEINTQLSLAIENAAAISGGKFTTLKGGIPIVVAGQVIGAVGVGGAKGEQDAEIAQAGVQALTAAIAAQAIEQ
jgi:glc operon protein GlcG